MPTADGRSPLKNRQLNDLRLLPTADDPRPTFFWSAESPRDAGDLTKTTPYPRLLWHRDTGVEITVQTADEHAQMGEEWLLLPPAQTAPEPMDVMRSELDARTPEDRAVLIEGQRQARMAALQAKMATLPDAALEALLGDAAAQATTGTVKRGPGRPKRAVSA